MTWRLLAEYTTISKGERGVILQTGNTPCNEAHTEEQPCPVRFRYLEDTPCFKGSVAMSGHLHCVEF